MPQPRARLPRSQDVADAAGVSRTTVSFVLNDTPNSSIPAATRQRVLDAAEKLGYLPSPEARALKMGRTQIVLVLLPDWPITGPLGVLLREMSAKLALQGLTMVSHQRSGADDLTQVLQSTTPAAVVAMCDLTDAEASFAEKRGVALMAWMGNIPGHANLASLNQADIGRLQMRFLADLGHTQVAYAVPSDPELNWFSEPRAEGARELAIECGVAYSHVRLNDDGLGVVGALESAMARGVTAICAYNDETAYSLLVAATDIGLAVPADLSVLGVDDSPISRLSRPAISSVNFNLVDEARRLASMVVSGKTHPERYRGDPAEVISVISRGTTARRPGSKS